MVPLSLRIAMDDKIRAYYVESTAAPAMEIPSSVCSDTAI
jgi:hypothetical protein